MCLLYSEPLVLGRELADGEELTVRSTVLAAGLAGLLVSVCVQIVVMNVLRGVLTVSSVGDCVEATVGDPVPAGLRLVSEENVSTVLPSEPSGHLLREVPDLVGGLLVHPVVEGRIEVI